MSEGGMGGVMGEEVSGMEYSVDVGGGWESDVVLV